MKECIELQDDTRHPKCPAHNTTMMFMYGVGFDYDRWLCMERGCYEEIELETTTYPEETL